MTTILPPDIPARQPADDFEKRHGRFGDYEIRSFPFEISEVRDSGAGPGQFTIVGHAAVYNRSSLELWDPKAGAFQERIMPGFFDDVLRSDPVVHHLWDHDSRWPLSSTQNRTLELSLDAHGLRMWSRVADTSYAKDLRVLMERRDVNGASFAFDVAEDKWQFVEQNGIEVLQRDLLRCAGLYDVTTCIRGAYPAADSQVAHSRALSYARATGRLPGAEHSIAPDEPVGAPEPRKGSGDQHDRGRLLRLRAVQTPRL